MSAPRLFAFLFCAFMLVTSREPPWADAHVVYATTESLIDRGQLDVQLKGGPPWFYAVRGGRRYGVFPLGNVIAMVPSYLAYKALRHLRALPDGPLYALCSHLSPALMMAAACALFFVLLRRRGLDPRWATLATLGLAFSTLVFIYARSSYSEALQTLVLLWLVERTLAMAERPTVLGLAWLAVSAGVLVNSKLVNVLFLPLAVTYVIRGAARCGRLGVVWRALPLTLVVFGELTAFMLWHNQLKTGSIWNSGYQIRHGVFSGDLFAGLYGLLFSTGKSAFLYSPPLLFALFGAATAWRRRRDETALLLGIIVLSLVFNAKFRHWHADYCWGPRHLTALTPLALLLAFPWLPEALGRGRVALRRYGAGAVVAVGLAVQLLGASIYWDHYIRILIGVKDQTGAAGWFQEHLSHAHYIPSFSPLRGQLWLLRHLVRADPRIEADAPWRSVVPYFADLREEWGRTRLDWWICDYFVPKPEPLIGLSLFGLLLAATATTGAYAFSRRGGRSPRS